MHSASSHTPTLSPTVTASTLTPSFTSPSSFSVCRKTRRRSHRTALRPQVPIFVFSFTCQQNIVSITNELRRPSQRRVAAAVALSETVAVGHTQLA